MVWCAEGLCERDDTDEPNCMRPVTFDDCTAFVTCTSCVGLQDSSCHAAHSVCGQWPALLALRVLKRSCYPNVL